MTCDQKNLRTEKTQIQEKMWLFRLSKHLRSYC